MSPPIRKQTKEVVYNIHKFFEERKKNPSTQEHQNDVNLAKLVASVTGFSERSVRNIVSEGRTPNDAGSSKFKSPKKNLFPKKRKEVDSFTGVIRRKVSQFYTVKKAIPTVRTLLAELKAENIIDCSREYLRKILHDMGFKFRSCQSKRKLIIERHDITRLRWHYIRDIRRYRAEGRTIFFLDETYVNQSHNVRKCWQSENERGATNSIGKGPRLIIVHAGGRDGFVNNGLLIFKSHSKTGDYHGDMNTVNFHKWITERLLPNIPPNSVVVMDNAAYHCTQIDKKPTMSCVKRVMQDWLTRRNVLFDPSARKCDLMHIINQQHVEKQYRIDEIINAGGHTVLRLPPYHPDLNPIELVWGDIKGELARKAIDSNLDQKKEVLMSLFSKYSAEKWRKCDDHVKNIEEEYFKTDLVIDDEMDRIIISLQDDSTDDSTEDEESSDSMECDDND
ncbi:hypothetical protein O0L34_g2532 [Tuta absoluta]|nr:hypothetical protein O0L34_g2532 [Tuta absoluta]